jgi:hypothetical protein
MKHPDVLSTAGLITRSKTGRTVAVRLAAEPLNETMNWLRRYERFWSTGLDRLAAYGRRSQGHGHERRRERDMTNLTLVRRIAARPSIVFDALTTPDGIAAWWGPDDGPVLRAETNIRVGGRFRVRFRMLDGTEHESSGHYIEVDKPTLKPIATGMRSSGMAARNRNAVGAGTDSVCLGRLYRAFCSTLSAILTGRRPSERWRPRWA